MEVESKPEEIENLDRRIIQLKIEEMALGKETDQASKDRLAALRDELGQPRTAVERADHPLAERARQDRRRRQGQGSARRRADRARAGAARGRSRQGGRAAIRPHSRTREAARRGRRRGRERAAARGSDRGRHRRRRQPLDRRAGRPDDGGRAREAARRWKARSAKRVIGQEAGGRRRCRKAVRRARAGPAGPEPAARQLPVPRPHRRRQDRADQGARRVPVRRRQRDGPHRHERVHGEARGQPPDRRASGLRRLRRRRRADRGGPPPALPGGAVRRGREGAPRRVQRAAAGARRRAPDRRAGPRGRFLQHADHPDLATSAASTSPDRGRAGRRRASSRR